MSKKSLFRDVIAKMTEAVTMDENNNLQIIDKVAMAEADEHFNRLMVEQASEWWAQLESAEDALADMSDQISFTELNADPSHLSSPQLPTDEPTEPSIDGMMESADFNLSSIFEELDDNGPVDGDDEYDKLITGNDDEGLGSDIEGNEFDDEMDDDLDAIGDEEDDDDVLSGDDAEFDFSFLNDGDDDLGDYEGFTESEDDKDDDEDEYEEEDCE